MCLPDLSDAHRLACIVACLAIVGGALAQQGAHPAGISAAIVLERHAFALAGRVSGHISLTQAWQALETIQEVLQPGEAAAMMGWERIVEMVVEIKKQMVVHLERSIPC